MTKQEIVDMINMLPGANVTTRARKATLLEILDDRQTAAIMAETSEMTEVATIMSCETSFDMDKFSKPMPMPTPSTVTCDDCDCDGKTICKTPAPACGWHAFATVAIVFSVALMLLAYAQAYL